MHYFSGGNRMGKITEVKPKGFDSDLQMFIEPEKDVKPERLRFMRWLVEKDRLEHGVFGVPSGEFESLSDESSENEGTSKLNPNKAQLSEWFNQIRNIFTRDSSGKRDRYDSDLQMFAEQQAREPDLARLNFLRWLGENNRLEHKLYGKSGGEYSQEGRIEGLKAVLVAQAIISQGSRERGGK